MHVRMLMFRALATRVPASVYLKEVFLKLNARCLYQEHIPISFLSTHARDVLADEQRRLHVLRGAAFGLGQQGWGG